MRSGLLTFDNAGQEPSELLGLLSPGPVPDLIECGENNEFWVRARRSTRSVELVSKVTGRALRKVEVSDLARDPAHYGVTPAQLGACLAAMKMRPSDGT